MGVVRFVVGDALGVGARVRIEQPKLRPAVWEVSALEPGESWTWVSRAPGIRTTAIHVLERVGVNETRVRQTLAFAWTARRPRRPSVRSSHAVIPRDRSRRPQAALRSKRFTVTGSNVEPQAALLQSVIDTIASDGLGARSLRDLARGAGTSHRMLIHHFGSRDGLLVAIVAEVEARQRDLSPNVPDDSEDAIGTTWKRLADPSMWPFERLFFECYARGAQGEEPFDQLFPGLIDDWLAQVPPGRARDQARLGVAVIRGLLLDLVATEDRAGVDRALKEFVGLLDRAANRA